MKRILLLCLLLVLLISLPSCEKNTICTQEFRTIMVQVESKNGESLQLDEVYTIRKSTGEKITYPRNGRTDNMYTVLDDSYRSKLKNRSDEFLFVGMIGTRKVFEESYQISADACHINKRSGKDKITID